MSTIVFQTPVRDAAGTVTTVGHPTAVPGLAVHRPSFPCPDHDPEPCWLVSHVRSGLRFPWCWPSPEAAGAFAEQAGRLGDWRITGAALERRISLPFVRRFLSVRAYALDAEIRHVGNGDPHAIDNGVPK